MRIFKFKCLTLSALALLGACGEEAQPVLNVNGEWHVQHGFYEQCEVNASFNAEQITLTFISLEEDACLPELFGLQDDYLIMTIDSREDGFADDGALMATFHVTATELATSGSLVFTESETGMTGSITDVDQFSDEIETLTAFDYPMIRIQSD